MLGLIGDICVALGSFSESGQLSFLPMPLSPSQRFDLRFLITLKILCAKYQALFQQLSLIEWASEFVPHFDRWLERNPISDSELESGAESVPIGKFLQNYGYFTIPGQTSANRGSKISCTLPGK